MAEFLVFCGNEYYPNGGWNDYKGGFDSIEEAIEFCEKIMKDEHFDWGQVVQQGASNEFWRFGENFWDER